MNSDYKSKELTFESCYDDTRIIASLQDCLGITITPKSSSFSVMFEIYSTEDHIALLRDIDSEEKVKFNLANSILGKKDDLEIRKYCVYRYSYLNRKFKTKYYSSSILIPTEILDKPLYKQYQYCFERLLHSLVDEKKNTLITSLLCYQQKKKSIVKVLEIDCGNIGIDQLDSIISEYQDNFIIEELHIKIEENGCEIDVSSIDNIGYKFTLEVTSVWTEVTSTTKGPVNNIKEINLKCKFDTGTLFDLLSCCEVVNVTKEVEKELCLSYELCEDIQFKNVKQVKFVDSSVEQYEKVLHFFPEAEVITNFLEYSKYNRRKSNTRVVSSHYNIKQLDLTKHAFHDCDKLVLTDFSLLGGNYSVSQFKGLTLTLEKMKQNKLTYSTT